MDKKRGYNIKYLLLFTSAAALLCALAAYISINDTYKYTRERAAFLAESYGSQTRYELMDLYDDAFVLRELIQQGMLDAKGTKIAVHEKGFRNMSELGIQRMNNVCTAFDDMALITNVSLAMAEGPLQDGIPEKTVISYCFPYEINKSALGKNLMIQPKRDDAIRKVYRKQGELVIEGPFRRIQDNELVLTGRVAVKKSDGSPWGLVAVTLDMNPASPKYALQNINFAALQGQKYRYHLYKIENGAKLTIAASDHAAMAMTGGMKYDIELPNASCIIEVDKAGGWVGNNIIFLNAGIAFFVWLLSVFAVKKWLENKEAHREIADSEELLLSYANGEQHWFRIRANCIIKKETVIRLVGKLDNIDAEMLEKEKLQDMSRIDQLTGVYNKAGFKTVVEPLLKESGSGSFIFTDLDNFKTVNDTLGHQTGDKVLQEMAAKLQQFFRSDDIIGRFGGDEFYIYAPGLSPEATVKRAEDLCRILHTTYDGVTVSASIGICYFPEHGRDFDKLVHLADVAAYVVKERGKGGYHVYEPGDKI